MKKVLIAICLFFSISALAQSTYVSDFQQKLNQFGGFTAKQIALACKDLDNAVECLSAAQSSDPSTDTLILNEIQKIGKKVGQFYNRDDQLILKSSLSFISAYPGDLKNIKYLAALGQTICPEYISDIEKKKEKGVNQAVLASLKEQCSTQVLKVIYWVKPSLELFSPPHVLMTEDGEVENWERQYAKSAWDTLNDLKNSGKFESYLSRLNRADKK